MNGNGPVQHQIGAAGEKSFTQLVKESGYIIIGGDKDVLAHGADVAAFKDGILYIIDVKESLQQGKIIYSVKGFQN
jgi:hypothetical protein